MDHGLRNQRSSPGPRMTGTRGTACRKPLARARVIRNMRILIRMLKHIYEMRERGNRRDALRSSFRRRIRLIWGNEMGRRKAEVRKVRVEGLTPISSLVGCVVVLRKAAGFAPPPQSETTIAKQEGLG